MESKSWGTSHLPWKAVEHKEGHTKGQSLVWKISKYRTHIIKVQHNLLFGEESWLSHGPCKETVKLLFLNCVKLFVLECFTDEVSFPYNWVWDKLAWYLPRYALHRRWFATILFRPFRGFWIQTHTSSCSFLCSYDPTTSGKCVFSPHMHTPLCVNHTSTPHCGTTKTLHVIRPYAEQQNTFQCYWRMSLLNCPDITVMVDGALKTNHLSASAEA